MAKSKNEKKIKEVKNEEVKVENQVEEVKNEEVKTEQELFDGGQAPEESMEMEMELDGEEITAEMEEIVSEKVKQEEKNNQEQKSKRGPKPKTEEEKAAKKDDKKEEKKEKALNLKDANIIQREIKKGRLTAPCFRIEKVDADNTYDLLMAPGIIFSNDAKGKYEKYDNTTKMVDGKTLVTLKAVETLGNEKFKAKHENGEEVEHDWVRVELHKPGRDKDVVELYSVREKQAEAKRLEAVAKKKEEDAKKKAEKEAAKKAEESKDVKEEVKEDKKEEASA